MCDRWLHTAELLIAYCTASRAGFQKTRVLFFNVAWQNVLTVVLNAVYVVFGVVWSRCTTLLGAKKNLILFMQCCSVFSIRFQLSLRVAAMFSKVLYRAKTMDSLDYRDLVCAFSNTVPFPLVIHLNLHSKMCPAYWMNDTWAEFAIRRLFSQSSAEAGGV